MKLSLKLGTKFIIALSILLIGFAVMAVMALGMNKLMKYRLQYIGDYLIPVVRYSEAAVLAFQEQHRLYGDLVITGEDNQAEEIAAQAERIAQALNSIMEFRELDPARRQQLVATLAAVQEFTRIAPPIYIKLSTVLDDEPETPEEQATRDHLQEQGATLATRSTAILNDLETLRDAFTRDLNAELVSIENVSRDIARRLVLTFAIVCVLVMTSITLVVKRSVIRPLLQIVQIAEQVSAGEQEIDWLPDSRDEIGVVNTALRTMTHNLREEIIVRKKAELSLRQAEKQYRMIFENSLEGIFQTRIDGKIFNANPALAQILHYDSPEDLLASVENFTGQLFASPDKGEECRCLLNDQGKVLRFETQLQCKHGELIWASISARSVRDPHGNVLYYEGSLMDITERKQAEALQHAYQEKIEQEVQERTRQLSETLEHLKATQQELIQSEKMAALGQLVAGVAHEINTPLGAIRASIGNIDHALQETIRQLPLLLQRLSPVQQEEFFALIDRALQDKQHLTSREERTLKRTLAEELAAHQLNDPEVIADTLVDMGIYQEITSFVPLLESQNADFVLQTAYNLTVQQHNSKNIMTAVERAAKIVFALKSYARYDQSGEKVETVITNGLDVVLTLYHNQLKHGIEVVKNYQPVPPILCYQDELNQVWTNLIQNAIQAMEGKGTLELTVNSEHFAAEDGSGPKEYVVVAITDSGCGVPPELCERIFEPFFTTKIAGEGSGLGLDICRKIIDKHQGKIELASKPGRTTFRVLLPLEI